MAQAAPKYEPQTATQQPTRAELEAALLQAQEALTIDNSAAAAMSPARHMQNTLGREFSALEATAPGAEELWSLRRTVAVVICTCGAFWTSVYFGIAALVG